MSVHTTEYRRHTRLMNRAYETGWEEGWWAALSRIEEIGLCAVLETERHLAGCQQMSLGVDPGHGMSIAVTRGRAESIGG